VSKQRVFQLRDNGELIGRRIDGVQYFDLDSVIDRNFQTVQMGWDKIWHKKIA
jgi:hypothetical protein